MRTVLIPVVAHRLYGYLHPSTGTVWTREPTLSDEPFLAAWSLSEAADEPETGDQPDTEDSRHRVSIYAAPGTRRSIKEIRDLFDGEGRAETTGSESVNAIWQQAAIELRLMAVVDHTIRTDHAILMSDVRQYARRLNQTGVLNMYFSRALDGAAGVGVGTRWPFDASKSPAFVFLSDWEETGISWEQMVWTAGHEVGHLLSLRHEGDTANLMWSWIGAGGTELRAPQVMVARDYAKRYEEAAHSLGMASATFRALLEDEEAEPMSLTAFAGRPWRFGEERKRK